MNPTSAPHLPPELLHWGCCQPSQASSGVITVKELSLTLTGPVGAPGGLDLTLLESARLAVDIGSLAW